VNPVPAICAELTVTAEVPVEVNTNDSALAVFTVTLPKARLVELTVNCGDPEELTATLPELTEVGNV